jgi:hexosaminidase
VRPTSRSTHRALPRGFVLSWITCLAFALGACKEKGPEHPIIPNPTSIELSPADTFHLTDSTRITVDEEGGEAERIGRFLADLIGNSVETSPEVVALGGEPHEGTIHLSLEGASTALGPEGYHLTSTSVGVTVRALTPAGLFYGVQTLRQLLPSAMEFTAALPAPLFVPGVEIMDAPRFEWRGAMLDVARHFFPPQDVKQFIDLMALYKLNRLHLGLTNDQGWRIEIPGRPNLTSHGSVTEVGGREGGFYTTSEYADLVQYAADRFIQMVPEIDVPGHTTAALSSYPELNCDGVAPDVYTGIGVGFSTLCVEREETYAFLEDVVRELSALTPGPHFHVGGDEVEELTGPAYNAFIERLEGIVEANGKRLVGWDEVAMAEIGPQATIQLWRPLWPAEEEVALDSAKAEAAAALQNGVMRAVESGARVILSPADRLYLDMKYDHSTPIGLSWAGLVDVRAAYDWTVADLFGDLPEESIAGVEGALWSETIDAMSDIEYLAFPRMAGMAELGWSQESRRSWEEYRLRLGAQAPRWVALGINFYRSPLVPWKDGSWD